MTTTTRSGGRRPALAMTLLALCAGTVTAAAPPETMEIWRATITIGVCYASDAQTDDPLKVQLNASNLTVLDGPYDDFEEGTTATYDLLAFHPVTREKLRLSDVSRLKISKAGSNGVKLCRLTLLINERTIYHRTWQAPGHLLDDTNVGGNNELLIGGTTLRGSDFWKNYGMTPSMPRSLSTTTLKRRMYAVFGTAIYRSGAYWHSSGVTVTRKDSRTVHVRVDLGVEIDNWYDRGVDVDFDLRFTCTSGRVVVDVLDYRVNADNDGLADVLHLFSGGRIGAYGSIYDVLYGGTLPGGLSFSTRVCPVIAVDAYGNVSFS